MMREKCLFIGKQALLHEKMEKWKKIPYVKRINSKRENFFCYLLYLTDILT